jgi:peptide/nickel transport system substrate-binding protein
MQNDSNNLSGSSEVSNELSIRGKILQKTSRKVIRRRFRKIEKVSLRHAHIFIIKRWQNARVVQRHALGWMVLVASLICLTALQMAWQQRAYSTVSNVDGGVYAEGTTGPIEVINPIFASTSSEQSASRLIFSGLVSYDKNNQLKGDLADSWLAEDGGRKYVVNLKQNVTWQDGKKFTADDVIFTMNRIKNPLTHSSLYNSWRDVKIIKLSEYQVAFELQQPYAPFINALTVGILPSHILSGVPPAQLREDSFNRSPIGTGPFIFDNIQTVNTDTGQYIIYLNANPNYMFGRPKLEKFQLHVYLDHDAIRRAFLAGEINAATDITSDDIDTIVSQKPSSEQVQAPVFDGVYALMRLDNPILGDLRVRQALRLAIDRSSIIKSISGASPLNGPLLDQQYSFVSRNKQPIFNNAEASSLLDKAGWIKRDNGLRYKDNQPLRLSVVTPQTGDFPKVLSHIASNWRSIGVEVDTNLVSTDNIQQNVLLPRAYDVFVYELAIGPDPDVLAYWHSSQADPRGLNLSNYRSAKADDALVGARSRVEPALRQRKYETFVNQWLSDVPAIALYQPGLPYVTSATTNSLISGESVSSPVDRYRNVVDWMVDTGRVFNSP